MLRVLGNLLWVGANVPGDRRFRSALGRCEDTQRAQLLGYLRANEATSYGREHDFHQVTGTRSYRDRVPLVTYDELQPWIERIARGEQGVLTTEEVKLFEPSSGSTRAAKWIPYTETLQAEFRRAVAPWIYDVYTRWPAVMGGPAYWSITPVARRPEDPHTVVPIGFEEDSAYLGGLFKGLVDRVLAVPGGVRRVHDMETFRRVTILYLLAQRELRLISVWHPTFLLLLLGYMEEHWDSLVEDLRRGVHVEDPELVIAPDPARAEEIAGIGFADVRALWPHLTFVSCWADGHARHAADELRARMPAVTVQPKGLISTEAFVTLPYRDRQVLAVTSHYFEFLAPDGTPFRAWELEEGGEYSVVLTTGGGLYRYQLRDRVRVTGFLESTPCLQFLGKEDRVSDLRGEKLSEGFVGETLDDVLGEVEIRPRFAMLAPCVEERPPGYVLYLESPAPPPEDLAGRLDAALRSNPHYQYARDLGQLREVRVHPVEGGAFERYAERLTARGQRLGDVKPTPLSSLEGWGEVFG